MNRKISILSAYIIISLLTGAEAGNPCKYTSTDNMFWEKSGVKLCRRNHDGGKRQF
jgi:hypothetical protein